MRRSTAVLITCGALTVAILGGCGGGSDSDGNSIGAQTLRHLSATEQRMLADKFVSVPEVEDAMDRERACIDAIPGAGSAHLARKGPVITVGVAFHASNEAAGHRAFAKCQADVNAVYAVYGLDHGPSSADRSASLSTLRRCASSAGVQTPSGAPIDSVMRSISSSLKTSDNPTKSSALFKCIDAYNDAAPLAPPGLAKALAAFNP